MKAGFGGDKGQFCQRTKGSAHLLKETVTGCGTVIPDGCWLQLRAKIQQHFGKHTGILREKMDMGLMVQMGHDGVLP